MRLPYLAVLIPLVACSSGPPPQWERAPAYAAEPASLERDKAACDFELAKANAGMQSQGGNWVAQIVPGREVYRSCMTARGWTLEGFT